MTGMPDRDRPGASEPKRRLSLRLHSAEKRVKGDAHSHSHSHWYRGRSGSRSRDDSINDDAPSTSASSSNRYVGAMPLMGQSAGSSETDDGSEWRVGSRRRSPRVPPPVNPASTSGSRKWGEDARDRDNSPPPSMTLSTGQPLVNPPLKTQAAFVGKLYSMLEDDEIGKTGLLHWAPGGHTFICPNPTEFSKAILPRFFKHNNWQSFVRQLNMYSFNKVNDLYATSSDPLAWEFRHPLFRQGEPHLLASIKRKSTRPSAHDGQSVISPSEEISEARAIAGWMRERDRERERERERDREVPMPHPSMHQQVQLQLQAQAHAQYQRERGGDSSIQTPRQVYGYNAVTGETIEARPYELTARASTREYCETLRRPELPLERRGTLHRDGDADRDRDWDRREWERVPERDRMGAGAGVLVRSRDRSEWSRERGRASLDGRPPAYNDPSSAYYPQPVSAPSPHSPTRSAHAHSAGLVPQLQADIARLRDALTQQRMQSAQRDVEAAQHALWLVDWIPGADSRDMLSLRQEMGRRESRARQELDAIVMADTANLGGSGPNASRPDTRRPDSDASYFAPTYMPPVNSTYAGPYTAPSPGYDSHSHPHSLSRPSTEQRSRASILPPPPPLPAHPSSARRDLGFAPPSEVTVGVGAGAFDLHPLPSALPASAPNTAPGPGTDRDRQRLPLPLPHPSEYRGRPPLNAHAFEPAPLLLPDSLPSVPPSLLAQPQQLARPAQPASAGPPVARAAAPWDGGPGGEGGMDGSAPAEWSKKGEAGSVAAASGFSVDGDGDVEMAAQVPEEDGTASSPTPAAPNARGPAGIRSLLN